MSLAKRHLALICLLLLSIAHQALTTMDAALTVTGRLHRTETPFGVEGTTLGISWTRPEAAGAGLLAGERLLLLDGDPFRGSGQLARRIALAAPGDRLVVTVAGAAEEGSGARRTISIPLAARSVPWSEGGRWLEPVFLWAILPWACILLGFWVAAVRPGDTNAWLVLAVLLSVGRIAVPPPFHWPAGIRSVGLLYHFFLLYSWPIWMPLFGILFPERLPLDRRLPWLKLLLLGPLALFGSWDLVVTVLRAEALQPAARLQAPMAPFGALWRILWMIAIGLFFACLGYKSGTATAPDARRRLRLLWTGTAASLTPTFVLVLIAMSRGTGVFGGAPWLMLPSLLLILLFPLTMAYVIVVHRALDVRVVVRQGVQYAFARRGIIVLRVLISFGMVAATGLLLTRPNMRRVEILLILGATLLAFALIGRLGDAVLRWTDRRFFRDAYNAEQILSDLSEQVRSMVETGPLLETVALRLSESLHVPRVAILLGDGSGYRPAHALGYATLPVVSFGESAGLVQRLRRDREPVRVRLEDPGSRGAGFGAAQREALSALGSELLLPLAVRERLLGFISLGAKRSEEPYSGTDLRLLRTVAAQTAVAIENSRLTAAVAAEAAQRERMQREVEIAREVQERLFPHVLPPVTGLDYAGACRPALGVGGDYYDFLALPGGRFGIAIADVSGKGIGAALMMASLQASLRGQILQTPGGVAHLVSRISRQVYEASPDNRYATFFYGQFDPVTRELTYVNAGHCPPVVLRRTDDGCQTIHLTTGGTVVGLFPEVEYREGSVRLGPGDLLVAWTDGISEALNPEEEEYGAGRVIEATLRCDGLASKAVIDRLMSETDAFVRGAAQYDDMTLVVVRLLATG